MFQPNQRVTVDLSGLVIQGVSFHRPARLQGRAPVQLQRSQAGGCAGGANPWNLIAIASLNSRRWPS